MQQMDLFATVRPPAASEPPSPVIVAAAEVQRALRPRSSSIFRTGPISDGTGGPLNAEEAERVIEGKTIRVSGYQFQDGAAICKACFLQLKDPSVAELHRLHGYRGVLYGGAEYRGGLNCLGCKLPIAP